MSFNSEYQKLRKKRIQQGNIPRVNNVAPATLNTTKQITNRVKGKASNNAITNPDGFSPYRTISPNASAISNGSYSYGTDNKNNTYLQKGNYFSDGKWDAWDLTKTILGTAADIGVNAFGALGDVSEGLLNFGATVVGKAGGLLGFEDFEKNTERFIKEDKIGGANVINDDIAYFTGYDADEKSFLGEKSDGLVQSGAQMMTASALQTVGVPWWVTMGSTSFGGKMSESLNEGASFNEAIASSAISAGAEILTEKLSGGIKFGGKALDDVLTQKLATSISNKFVRTALKLGVDITGEAGEEFLSQAINNFGEWLTYRKDEELWDVMASEEALEGYLESAISGGLLGGFSGGYKIVKSARHGVDYTSQLTSYEEKVVNAVYENRIAEMEADGKKATAKEKNKIYDEVKNDLNKGRISIDTIESVLGGETYKQYQSAVEKDNEMKELQKEYDTLYRMKNGEKSDEQIDRQKELKQQLEEYKNTSKLSDIKKQLSNEVSELAKSSKLVESYNEKSRKSQAFEADLSKYDAKMQETVKRAIDSGILNNTNRTHEFVDLVAKLSADKGVPFDFTNNEKIKSSGFAIEGKQVNGYVQGNNISINIDSTSALNKVVGHEITHVLEGTELYNELANAVKEFATAKGEYDSKLQSITKLYEGVEDANIENEVVAELVGEYLFSDPEFIKRLSTEQPTLFKKIFDEIKYLCKVATAGSKEARQLEKAKKTFEEAYRQKNNTATNDGVKYSIEKFDDGKQYVKADRQVFSGNDPKQWGEQVTDYINDTIRHGKDVVVYAQDGDALTITENTAGKAAFRNDVKLQDGSSRPMTDEEYAVKLRAESHIDEISQVSRRGNKTVPDYKNHNFAKDGFNYRTAYFMDADGKYYRLTLSVGKNGVINTVYNVGKIKEEGKYSLRGSKPVTDESVTMRSSSSNNSVPQDNSTVNNYSMQKNAKYSLSNANDDIGPVRERNNVYGEDIKLQVDGPVREDVKSTATTTETNTSQDLGPTAEDIKKQNSIVGEDEEFTILEDSETPSAEINIENTADTIDTEAVTRLSSKVISTLGIGKSKANRNAVRELVKVLGDNYSISSKEDLYNAVAEKFGTQYVEELNEEIAGARSYLKEVKINVTNSVKSEFGSTKDYSSFVKSNFGKLWISKEGAGIDQIYAELNEMYPHLFPEDIVNQADQLKQISDVVNKPKSDFVPFELDDDVLQEATDLIYDSVTEYRDAVSKVNEVTDSIEVADVSDKVKKQIKDELLTAYEKIEAEFNIDKKNLVNELNERRNNLEADTVDKNTFLTNHTNELYNELKGLKKGIKASEDLAYFLDLGFNWNELKSTFLKVGKWPDTVLNSESEIEKTVRDFLDQKYDDTIQELNDFDWTMEDEISSLESKAEEKRNNARLAVNGKLVREIMDAEQVAMMGDTSLWKDKNMGLKYKTNTERRNFRDIVKDKFGKANIKLADALNDYFMGTYNHNEAELKREAAVIQKNFADLKLNKYEDVFVQMKGEFLHNPHTELTQHDIDTFKKLYGDKVDEAKVDKTIDMARETYDSLIERMNEVLVAHGMKPIEYRRGYFPHFSEVEKTKWQNFAEKFLNWKTQNNDIPTDIAGMTESFKPNRSWQSFNKQRIGDETDYSFMKGFDGYLQGSLDWIYHIDDIMKRRVFENRIRYDHSDEGVKKQIQEIYKNNEFDTNAKQEQIDLVFREAKNPLNNFIIDFRTRTNTLAGKKSSMDRGMEEFTSRKFYSTATNLNNRITANMVVGSVSSALTNFIPITQSWGEVSPVSSLKAMRDTIKSTFKDDGTINKSDFLTNRLNNVEKLYQTGWDKVINKAGWLMESIDSFTSQTVWRSKYLENMSKGMSEAEAIKNADQFAENVLAGRSRGNMPTIFDSKNPLIKMATAFQLEVNNQYGYMFKDMPQDMKDESVAKLAKGYATMFIGAYAYNAIYSSLTGRDAAFDPIGIIQELLSDLFDDEEDEPVDIIMNLTDNVLEEIPFIGGFLGGGRIPISSALPYDDGIRGAFEGTITDLSEGDIENLTKEWLSSAGAYLLLPAGGGQLKKTVQGLSMFDDDLPIAGSYTDSGKLRFTVEETMDEMLRAGLFGQYASKNARQYFDEGRTPLTEKQTQELADLDIPIADYWKYRDGLAKQETLDEKFEYINDLDLTDEQKNILINNIVDRKENVDISNYDDFSGYDEFDFYLKNQEKYEFLQSNNISYAEYTANEDTKEKYDNIYSWYKNNPEQVTVSKAVTSDVMEYKHYTSELYNIKADKDRNGKSISGSRKEKVINYINGLDLDMGAKMILFRSEYPADDTYNADILDYVNGRNDLTYTEKVTILKGLDFNVDTEGNVWW